MHNGKLCQWPARELEKLRGAGVHVHAGEGAAEPGRLFDAVVSCSEAKTFELRIREGVTVRYADGMLTLDMDDEGYGRDVRSVEVDELRDLRVLSDTTLVEILPTVERLRSQAVRIRLRYPRWSCMPRVRPRWSSIDWLSRLQAATSAHVGYRLSHIATVCGISNTP